MTQADRIRKFVLDNDIAFARSKGVDEVTIRAGDVHQAMGLLQAMPAICSAIGSRKFQEFAGVRLTKRIGPAFGANVYFTFSVRPDAPLQHSVVSHQEPIFAASQSRISESLDLRNAIVLVSCVKSKLQHSAPARELYTSAWFRKVRNIVEASSPKWFVLSSRYGLVAPNAEIAPYDYTLNNLGVADRKDWAAKVLVKLQQEIAGEKKVIFFAGYRYRQFLIEPLRQRGIEVEVPMTNLTRGEQLAWLCQH